MFNELNSVENYIIYQLSGKNLNLNTDKLISNNVPKRYRVRKATAL